MGKSKFCILKDTWICLLLLPSCIEFRENIGHKVKFFAMFNFLVLTLSTVKIKSAKYVIFPQILHCYLKPCTV